MNNNKVKSLALSLFLTAATGFAYAQTDTSKVAENVAAQVQTGNATIDALNKQIQTNPQDTDALVKLATEYQNTQNWQGAIETWDKVIALVPDWSPAYYSKGYAYQSAKDNGSAKTSYEKYVATVKPAEVEGNKQSLGYAYFFLAFSEQKANPDKAKEYIAKSLQYDSSNQEAVKLSQALNS